MSAALRIRPATRDDVATLAELERRSFADPWDEHALAAEIDLPSARVDVVLDGVDALAGYAAWRLLPGECELLKVAVRPDLRRHGIARRLIEHGLLALGAAGAAAAYLEVRASNPAAIALYEKLGFERAGLRPRYYRDGTSAWVFRRTL